MIKVKKNIFKLVFPILLVLSTNIYANVLHDAVTKNDFQSIDELLKTNPSLMQGFDQEGNTPIHLAIKNQFSASLQAFMKYKKIINPQIVNTNGETPLVYAIKNKKYDSLVYMLNGGFNPFYTDSQNKDSFDYVRQYGDDTIKEIYNDYYSRNRDRIDQLKQLGKQGNAVTPSKPTVKEPISLLKNTGKPQTVADLLLNNSKSKRMAEVGSAEPDSLDENTPDEGQQAEDTKLKMIELSKKIESLKTDRSLLVSLQDKVKLLELENGQLKSQLDFKKELGRDYLTEEEKLVANSKYAPIYQQQVFYENANQALNPTNDNTLENSPIISDMSESSIIPNTLLDESNNGIENSKDFKADGTAKINEIEQQLPILNGEVSKQIKEANKLDKTLLPLDNVPDNQAVAQAINTTIETPIEGNTNIESKTLIDAAPVSSPSVSIPVAVEPALKINIETTPKEELAQRFTSDKAITIIISLITMGILCIMAFLYINYKEFKQRKIKKPKVSDAKKEESESEKENSTFLDKEKI